MDLIERLRARANEERAVPDMGHNAAERERSKLIRLLTEAADALESARAVDEAMVERACRHWYIQWDIAGPGVREVWAKAMSDLLTAALAAQPGGSANG